MEKLNSKHYLLFFAAVISLVAFIYLNTVSLDGPSRFGVKTPHSKIAEPVQEEDEVKEKSSDINLPSIETAKNVITVVKRFLPAS